MPDDYFLCGWRVRSALPIPELIPWPDPTSGRRISSSRKAPFPRPWTGR